MNNENALAMSKILDQIVEEFRADPRNKVFAPESLLRASAHEETGHEISPKEMRALIAGYSSGSLEGDDLDKMDGALFACGVLARRCFGEHPEDEEEDVDYSVSWIENDDGSYSAEIRPS